MYSDFFDPPDDIAAEDKGGSDADKMDEKMDYSSDDEEAGVSDDQHSDENKDDETSDDGSADDVEQPPVKKAKSNLRVDE